MSTNLETKSKQIEICDIPKSNILEQEEEGWKKAFVFDLGYTDEEYAEAEAELVRAQ